MECPAPPFWDEILVGTAGPAVFYAENGFHSPGRALSWITNRCQGSQVIAGPTCRRRATAARDVFKNPALAKR